MIINYSLNNPRSVVMITITLLLLGCVAIVSLPNEYLPEISTPQIIVNTIYPSATPKDIREKITIPLENALSSVKGLKNISSVSRNSISTIELNLKWGVNPIESELQIREAIDGVYMNLPQDSLKPRIIPYDPNSETLALIGVSSQTINLAKLTKISQDEIITKLQKIDGVGRVNIIGGRESELQILANQEKLSSMGLTPETVANIFKNTHIRYPSGSFIANNKEYMVIGNSNLTSINEVRNMNIPIENGTIKLSDVATVSLKDKTQISSFFFNGKEGIGLEIKKRKGVNQNIVINHLLKEIRELNVSYNGTLELYIIDNNYKKTSESVNTILESLILGSIISFLMLFIISGNIFSALLIIITIPTSLTITFLVMKLLNISINIMSLGGIAISIGMLLDNSVIVIDNINRTQNIPLGTREVSKSNLVSTITTLIVFTPLLLMPGIIGAIYKELAISISITLLSSYIISVSLLPTIYKLRYKKNTIYIKNINFKLINKVEWIYSKTLKYFIRRHLITKILVLVLIILTLLALKFIPVSFSSPEIDNKILLTAEMSGNTSMDKLLEARDEINRIILQNPTVINTTYRVGANRDDMDFYGNPVTSSTTIYGTIYIDEKMIKNKENLIKNIENSITFNNIKIKLFESQDSIGKLLKMGNTKYSWSIYSRDQETLQNINWSAIFPNSSFFPTGSNSVISSVPNLRMLSNIGVTPKIILEFIRSYISGLYLGELEIDKSFTPIKIIHKDFNMLSVTDLSDLILPLGGNRSIRIGDYVNFKVIEQNKALLRLNKKDSIIIKSNELLNFNSLKDDYNLEVISNNDSVIYEKSREILYIFALALLFLFLFLVIQFESFKAPLLILLSLPLSIPGVFLAIIISKNSINITSSLGLLTLFGITVNSSIILKEKSNTLLKRGKNVVYSSFISSLERLKPILATSLTTVFSLLPIAFQLFGSNTQSGMAWVIIGGMFSSTILSLYLIPILSMRFYEKE